MTKKLKLEDEAEKDAASLQGHGQNEAIQAKAPWCRLLPSYHRVGQREQLHLSQSPIPFQKEAHSSEWAFLWLSKFG